MMKELLYVTETGNTWFSTGIPSRDGIILEADYLYLPVQGSLAGHKQMFGCGGEVFRLGTYGVGIYVIYRGGTMTTVSSTDIEGSVRLEQGKFALNGTEQTIPSGSSFNGQNVICGANENGGGDALVEGRIGTFRLYYDDVLQGEFVPCLDDNDTVCFWNTVLEAYVYPTSGEWVAGPIAHTFKPSVRSITFTSEGSAETFTVSAETTWECTTSEWVAISPSTGDSGTTVLTVSVPEYSGTTARVEDITFTDDDGYTFDVRIRQRAPRGAGWSNIYLGDTELTTLYIGDVEVVAAYLGEDQVFSNGTLS